MELFETYYYIYKITNNFNDKFYIGCHRTKKLDDNYMGSGNDLKKDQKLQGIDKFHKEILFFCDSESEMYLKESEIVTKDFLLNPNVYNKTIGGYGGFHYCNSYDSRKNRDYSDSTWQGSNATMLSYIFNPKRHEFIKVNQDNFEKGREKIRLEYLKTGKSGFSDKSHSEETLELMKKSHKGKHGGSKNSQFGTMWICKDIENKKIKKDDFLEYEKLGWVKGRKLKSKS